MTAARTHSFRLLASLVLALALVPFAALAQSRHALVIGNDAYAEVPRLQKAVNDAVAISGALEAQGFTVATLTDAPRRAMNRAISNFTQGLRPGDTALVFYAGHGVEIDGENYLLPVDIEAPGSGDGDFVKAESIALSRLLDRIRATGARTTLAIIDACRENPFAQSGGRGIGTARGLGRVIAPEGTFVIFSAGAGQLALDRLSDEDANRNSVFTRSLLPRLAEPDLELREMVGEVRQDVRDLAASVGHQQFPAYYDELLGDFYLASEVQPSVEPATEDPIRRDFALAREIGSREALEAFVTRYEGRNDAFELSLARQLLATPEETPQEAETATPEAEPAPVEEVAALAPETSQMRAVAQEEDAKRATMRDTQRELNRLGCDAGWADGVAGPRTRDAFARYLSHAGNVGLAPGDLGSEKALKVLQGWKNRVCPAPPPASAAWDFDPTSGGVWLFRASCPLFIKSTGTHKWTRTGSGYTLVWTDSLGQGDTMSATIKGRQIHANGRLNGINYTLDMIANAAGTAYSGASSAGCRVNGFRR